MKFEKKIEILTKNFSRQQFVFLPVIAVLLFACLMASNIASLKPLQVSHWVIPGGAILFPLNYSLVNVLTEVYGFRWARFLIYLSVVCNLLCVFYFLLIEKFPAASFLGYHAVYDEIFTFAAKIFVVSCIAYLTGQYMNAYFMSRFKKITRGRKLWLRLFVSTFFSSFIDSMIFIGFLFFKSLDFMEITFISFLLAIFKLSYEIVIFPLTRWVIQSCKKFEGINIFEYDVRYTPFSLDLSNLRNKVRTTSNSSREMQ